MPSLLDINGFGLPVADEENISTWEALAAGTMSEAELAMWLRRRARMIVNEITSEGESGQVELIPDTSTPILAIDGLEFE